MEIPSGGGGGGGRREGYEKHPSGGLIYSDFVTNDHGKSWDSSCEIK